MLLMEYDYATDIEVQREEAFEKGVSKGIQQGVSQGEHQAKIETAKNMVAESLGSLEQISKITGLSVDEIKSLAK